jgi:hypothetical protein
MGSDSEVGISRKKLQIANEAFFAKIFATGKGVRTATRE